MYGYTYLPKSTEIPSFTALNKVRKFDGNTVQLIQQKRAYVCPPKAFFELAKFDHLELDMGYSKKLDFQSTLDVLSKIPNIKALSLIKCHSDTLPDNIGNLKNLQLLWLRNNEFGTVPDTFSQLTELEDLNLRSCEITTFPKALFHLKKLKKLVISNNKFAILPDELFELTALEYLDIGSCDLTEISEKIGQLTNLKTLILDKNRITDLPDALLSLPKLEKVTVLGNRKINFAQYFKLLAKLKTETLSLASYGYLKQIPEDIGLIKTLKNLNLSLNPLKSLPESIGELNNLETLNLRGNQLSDLPASFAQLTNLKTLDIGENQFSKLPKSVLGMSALTGLTLDKNQLTTFPKNIDKLQALVTINCSQNQLVELPDSFANLSKLQSIAHYGNPDLDLIKHKNLLSPKASSPQHYITDKSHIPDDWNDLKAITYLSINGRYSNFEIPEEIGQLTLLKNLRIYDFPNITKLPTSIGQLDQLRILDIHQCSNLTALPDIFKNLTNLERLTIRRTQLNSLPASIFQLENLKHLAINGNQLHLPKEIGHLKKLEYLDSWSEDNKTIPVEIAECTQLKTLRIGGTQLDLSDTLHKISGLSNLEMLTFYSGDLTGDLSELRKLKSLKNFSFNVRGANKPNYEKLLDAIGDLPLLESLNFSMDMRELPANIVNLSRIKDLRISPVHHDRKTLIKLPIKIALSKQPIPKLWVNSQNQKLFDKANHFIENHQNTSLSDLEKMVQFGILVGNISGLTEILPTVQIPHDVENCFLLSGRMQGMTKKEIEGQLKIIGDKLVNKVTSKTTHLILTTTIKEAVLNKAFEEKIPMITEDQFKEFLWSKNTPYMMEAGAENMNQQIIELFLHEDDTNFGLALELVKGGGATKEVVTCLLSTMLFHPDTTIRRIARNLFKTYAGNELQEHVKARWQSRFRNRLPHNFNREFSIHPDIEPLVFALMNSRIGMFAKSEDERLKLQKSLTIHTPITQLSELIFLRKNISHLSITNDSELDLEQIFEVAVQLKNLTQIYISNSKITAIPDNFYKLNHLTHFCLVGQKLTHLPDSSAYEKEGVPLLPLMDNFALSFQHAPSSMTNILDFKHCPKLKWLRLKGILAENVANIDQLSELYHLEMMRARMTEVPPAFANLKTVANFKFQSNQIKEIPLFLTQLPRASEVNFTMNQITAIPMAIFDSDIGQFRQFKLTLRGNPLTALPEKLPEQWKSTTNRGSLVVEGNFGFARELVQELNAEYPGVTFRG